MIDLRSDTFSLPSPEMRARIASAEVGDDYYREDPSVARLEDHCRTLFDTEAALFTASGMQANQLAVATQVTRGNEVVTEYGYHQHLYESAQYAALCHVILNPRTTADGVLRAEDVERTILSKPRDPAYAQVQLVAIENTIGTRAGKVFPFDEIRRLRQFTHARGIRLHLDGARIFNAHVASGVPLAAYAREVDTLTISFSKGLGAPFGSMLLGRAEVIELARRLRIWYGSGFHQIGFCAEAASFALTHQFGRLAEDHRLARLFAERLQRRGVAIDPGGVETNMVFLDLTPYAVKGPEFCARCRARGVLVLPYPPSSVRFVICRNVDEAAVRTAADVVADVCDDATHAGAAPVERRAWTSRVG